MRYLAITLAGLLCIGTGAAVAEEIPTSPAMHHLTHFPTQMGRKSLYVTFYASRKHKQRQLVEKTFWDEVMETALIHGFRVAVVRTSTGALTRENGAWNYGEAESTIKETIYIISSQGVDLRHVYTVASGSDEDYAARRSEALESLASESREEFIAEMQNWILPFPLTRGTQRKWAVDDNSYYKVLSGGDKRFLNKKFKKSAYGVAGFIGGEWGVTRWFAPGQGLVLSETYNTDEGIDAERFPYKVQAMAVYAKPEAPASPPGYAR